MSSRYREEILNTVLAQGSAAYGLHTSPEALRRYSSPKPNVLLSFRDLRCVMEGKTTNVGNAKALIQNNAIGCIDLGLTQYGVCRENC